MKHNRKFETFNYASGGLELPIHFSLESPIIKVRWASISIEARLLTRSKCMINF